jgi:hypothetical protein
MTMYSPLPRWDKIRTQRLASGVGVGQYKSTCSAGGRMVISLHARVSDHASLQLPHDEHLTFGGVWWGGLAQAVRSPEARPAQRW